MQTIRELIGERIVALDGSIGTVEDAPASGVACAPKQVRLDGTREQRRAA